MRTAGAGQIIRPLAVAVGATLLAFQVVRTAAVEDKNRLAARLWPSHPALLIEQSMAEIGAAAAKGEEVPAATRERVRTIAKKAPLAAEPFLIEGAVAQTEGHDAAAERLFLEARAGDPRSGATRYFLADRFFRTGRIAEGLVEMAALSRLEPRAAAPFVPALVAFAATPGAVPQLKRFFVKRPEVEPAVLSVLADDAKNADLVLALASSAASRPDQTPDWQGKIVANLASSGEYAKAYATWAKLSGVRPAPGLFNPDFAEIAAPPPFNWSFPTTGDGVAEPGEGGTLQLLYYGRKQAVLATQLLLLEPGRYRLGMEVSGDGAAAGLQWSVRCANQDEPFYRLPLRGPASGGIFAVPAASCPAQWLELSGTPGDFPRTVDLTIGKLRLVREEGS